MMGKCSFRVWLLAVLVVAGTGMSGIGHAQEDESENQRETRTTPAIRESIYRQLSEAQEAAEEEQYETALEVLDDLRDDRGLNSYERAQVWNIYAYIHIGRDDYERAVEAYERLLSQENLPLGLETSTRYSLAQLYFGNEQYEEAATTLETWFEQAEDPAPDAYILLGNAYYSLGEYQRALGPAQKGVELARQRDKPVKEHWWQLLRALHYELGELDRVAEILEHLVERYPRKDYWMQLASIYGEMDRSDKQVRVLGMAYQQDLLTGESELINLAQLLMQQGIPYRAAKVIQEGLDEGVVERNVRHLRLLAQAYRMAKEDRAALEPLRTAAEMSGEGDLYMQLAYSYSNLKQWPEAAAAAREALDKGGLERPGQAHLFRGTALFNAGELEGARASFRAATEYESSAQRARQWLSHVDKEIERLEQLADLE